MGPGAQGRGRGGKRQGWRGGAIRAGLPLRRPLSTCPRRGLKDMELDTSSIEKRFAFGFLQQLLRWMDTSQEFIAHLGMEKPLPTPPLSLLSHREPQFMHFSSPPLI